MMGGRLRDPRVIVAAAMGLGLAVRLGRVAEWPLLHPDGPAYVSLTRAMLRGEWTAVLGGYYSPLYPMATAPLVATGVPAELAARLVATFAGVLVLPLVFRLARAVGGDTVAAVTVVLAAVHPALVKASSQVLPETLAGLFVMASGLVLFRGDGAWRASLAGVFAGLAYLARPEAVLLVPIGATWLAWRRRPTMFAAFVVATAIVMAPAVLALHAQRGTWKVSPREGMIARHAGLSGETSLPTAVLHHPGAVLGLWARGVGEQGWDTLVALGPILALPFVIGVWTLPPGWPLVVAAAFVVGPLALNPSPRYAVPVLPLLLPWAGAGLIALAPRSGRRAGAGLAVVAMILIGQALWKGKPFDEACSREVRDLLVSRYGRGQTLVAVDGRFAYVAEGTPVVPKTTAPKAALDLARARNAHLWLTRPQWLGKGFTPPDGVREVARPCRGVFVLFEVDTSP